MKKEFLCVAAVAVTGSAWAVEPVDTTKVVDLEEVVVISSPKENTKLRQSFSAVTMLSALDMQKHRVLSLKGVSTQSPNLFIPDYGSRLTSAIYIRGVGSRINTPAVGMYVDNIPYIDKSAFDFNFYDIERIDVLRGPQGTLYGRNAMAGLIQVHTRNPFNYQGTDVKLGYASGDNHRNASVTHYHRVSDKFAFSGGGYYEGSDGFFKNNTTGKKNDYMNSAGARVRGVWKANDVWTVDFNVNYDYNDEGGYPYYYLANVNNDPGLYSTNPKIELHSEGIVNNRESNYRRNMLNAGVNVQYLASGWMMNAATGYQYLNDRMFLDQDFTAADLFTLEQKQRLHLISEEVTFRSRGQHVWDWVIGATGYAQALRTLGPVTFHRDGMQWLESTINSYLPSQTMPMNVKLNNEEMLADGRFQTPVTNLALFHQSTFHLTDRLSATLGVRLNYEHMRLDYDSQSDLNFDFTMTSERMPMQLKDLQAAARYQGQVSHNYVQLLPKMALKYDFDAQNNVYASVSKGYRSGGYNVQMFSEFLQVGLRNQMMRSVQQGGNDYLDALAKRGMPQQVIDMVKKYMKDQMPIQDEGDVAEAVTYKPEYSWNYEVGAHLGTANNRLQVDMAAFLMNTYDQQVARFTDNGLGRMMTNAGRSRSYGAELSMRALPNRHLSMNLNYGYTHATFLAPSDNHQAVSFEGNYVPCVPMHTLSVGADYTVYLRKGFFQTVTFGANLTGAGRIYWDEQNGQQYNTLSMIDAEKTSLLGEKAKQNFYALLNAHVTLDSKLLQLNFWGRNLTDTRYNTFAFESMQNIFEQHGKPLQVGVDVRFHF